MQHPLCLPRRTVTRRFSLVLSAAFSAIPSPLPKLLTRQSSPPSTTGTRRLQTNPFSPQSSLAKLECDARTLLPRPLASRYPRPAALPRQRSVTYAQTRSSLKLRAHAQDSAADKGALNGRWFPMWRIEQVPESPSLHRKSHASRRTRSVLYLVNCKLYSIINLFPSAEISR